MKKCKYYHQCKNAAVVLVPHSNTPLCKEHFIQNIEDRTLKTISTFKLIDFNRSEKILVALSGGKDSQTLLTILVKSLRDHLTQKLLTIEALYIDLGISPGSYSHDSGLEAQKLCSELGIPFHNIDVKKEYGFDIDDVHQLRTKLYRSKHNSKYGHFRGECSYCGLLKRYSINQFAIQHGFTKLATGHNLTDESTALISNFLNVDLDLMARAGPTTETDVEMLVPRIKPLYFIYENETILYAFYANVHHLATECEYANDNPMLRVKRSLQQIENYRRGNMLHLMRKFQSHIKPLLFAQIPEYKLIDKKCASCGMATYLDRCSFCTTRDRLLSQIQEMKEYKEQKS
jgi:uncharacterized protein (TIGR00269 family)